MKYYIYTFLGILAFGFFLGLTNEPEAMQEWASVAANR